MESDQRKLKKTRVNILVAGSPPDLIIVSLSGCRYIAGITRSKAPCRVDYRPSVRRIDNHIKLFLSRLSSVRHCIKVLIGLQPWGRPSDHVMQTINAFCVELVLHPPVNPSDGWTVIHSGPMSHHHLFGKWPPRQGLCFRWSKGQAKLLAQKNVLETRTRR